MKDYFPLLLNLGINKIGKVINNYNFFIKPFFRFFFKYYLKNFNSMIKILYKNKNRGYLPKINFIL